MMLKGVLGTYLMSLFLMQSLAEPMKARLVNGTNTAGRLEINYNGEWGTVCDDEFGKEETRVACRMLGLNDTEATAVSSVIYGQGSGRILLDDVSCSGAETSLEQCSHSGLYSHNCGHSEDVGVICSINEPLKARLVNGTNTAGRLEINYNGEWGTVCNHGFGKAEASVACMMLGFNSTEATVVSSVIYGPGSSHILLDDVRCTGAETSLAQCSHRGLYLHNCRHSEDVGVICNYSEPIKARLVNGTNTAGRLEIYYNGEWGTVCNHEFGKEEASVACMMLGFNSTEATVVRSVRYGQGSSRILLDDVRCSGAETSLAQCSHSGLYSHNCGHSEDVAVICNIIEPMKARLINGTNTAGRLEIYYNGEWGTVCDNEFGMEEARVACRMLGFNGTDAAVVSSLRYGPGSSHILLSNVRCQGNERSLAQCDVGQFYPSNCYHRNDVGVVCNITEPMKARLVNGTKSSGRLEIYYNGEWGTVCNYEFGKEDARVACMMLGFNSTEATVVRSVIYGQGSGHILLDNIGCSGAETSLAQCSHRGLYLHTCGHSEDVGVICSISEPIKARLVNGTNTAGRLEINYNGEWGTVCNDEFGKEEARVACMMLGFNITEATVVSSVRYGPGSGHILLDDVRCSGAETSLAQCSHSGLYSHNCRHSDDVAVICNIIEPMKARLVNGTNTAGRLEINYNGEWGTVCNHEFGMEQARVACRMLGFNGTGAAVVSSVRYGPGSGHILLRKVRCQGNERSLAQCDVGQFYPSNCNHMEDVGVVCNITEPMKARLVNGTKSSGRLEIYYNGEWGTVCNDQFEKEDARVACMMLGFNSTETAVVSSVRFGQGSGHILLDNMRCTGAETSLAQCSHRGLYSHNCGHSKDVGVICSISELLKARLVNGTNEAGRLEIYYDVEWGTVCNHEFGKEDARVACRMLGFNSTEATVVSSVRYGQGSGPIVLDDVRCSGAETSLAQCSHRGLYSHNCAHSESVGVICNMTEPMKARLVSGTNTAGRLEIYYNGEWGTVCKDEFGKEESRVACRMLGFSDTEVEADSSVRYGPGSGRILLDDVRCSGAETTLEQCSHSGFYSHNCDHSEDVGVICNINEPLKARLVNGTNEAGRLEIYYKGEWGTVCNHEFGKQDARVACRMLGFNSTEATVVSSVRYGQGSGRILLDDVRCSGAETSLAQCSHSGFYSHNCGHSEDVGVICNITGLMKARLVNGTMEAGRLEIYFNGEWGTVCRNGFGKEDAYVACKMLGFNGTGAAVVSSFKYGPGSGDILLSNVRCKGNERSLAQCDVGQFYPSNCNHRNDVGVVCKISEPTQARLVNGTKTAGRLELYYNGEWGTVCNHEFGKEDARVACRMLGFNSTEATVVSSVRYGQGSGRILLDDVRCSGRETSLARCRHRGLYSHNCRHSEDVGVICSSTEVMKARLVNGTMEAGRLEIYFNGEWGTVCRKGFGNEDAYVACKMLGFNSTGAAVVSSVTYGPGSGHILLSNVRCRGNERSLAQCDIGQLYPSNCNHRNDVGVVCNISEPMKARLVNGTNTAGRLELYYNGEWGTVCKDDFGKAEARVACMMLGFNGTEATVVSSDKYGKGSGPILLDNVQCDGEETSLAQCSHPGIYSHNCGHSRDVSVICTIISAEPMKARLVNGTNEAGRLEIYYNGEWGTVCNYGFGKEDARVACRMLGFNSTEATVVSSVRYGEGSGHILMGDVRCSGAETSLKQCSHSGLYSHDCDHSKDVGVICIITSQSLKIQPPQDIYSLDVTQQHAGVTFSCSTENAIPIDDAQVEWYDVDGQRIPRTYEGSGDNRMFTYPKGETTLMMKIPSPDITSDNGRYTCKGIIQGNNVEASITLELFRGIELLSNTTQYPLLGHDEKINCTVTSSLSIEISWMFHNWQPIPGGGRYSMQNDFLLIKNVTEADDGTYYCSVTLSNGNTKDYPIKVIGSKVPVMTGPVTSLPPSPKAGDTLELTCLATGRPTPTYMFYKVEGSNDVPLNPESVTNGKLIIKDITQENEGTYKCQASNIKGSAFQEFPIDVMIPPKIDPIETLSESEGNEGRLSCSAVGDPQPSVTWKRENQNYYYVEQPSGDDRIYVEIERTQEGEKNEKRRTTATLVFKSLQPDDMHRYICEASNTVGTDEAIANVEVKYKPNFSSQQQTVFYGWVGSDTNLTCKANGNPEPLISWSFGDSDLSSTGNYIIRPGTSSSTTQTISYLIPTVRLDNVDSIFGTYVCKAGNRHGESRQELQFTKAVLPGKPQLTVVDRKSTLLEIAVTPPANDGGQPVKKYLVKYGPPTASDPDLKTMTVDINPADPSNTKVQLRNLEAKTEYKIKIAAITSVGTGLDADIFDSTLEVSVPGRVDITSDKNGLDGNRYTLTWVTTLTGGADITDYEIKYAKVDVTTDSSTGTWSMVRTPSDYKIVSVPGTSSSQVLENLDKNSYYHVSIVAVNRIGKSEEADFIFKTSVGGESSAQEVEVEDYEESDESQGPVITGPESDIKDVHEAKGEGKMTFRGDTGGPAIGTGGIVGIIVVLLLVLVVIVDVAFCVTKQCGLFWTIRQAVGSKEPGPGASSKSPEEGDEAAAKLLGKEKEDSLRNENEVAKEAEPAEEAGHDAEEKKELEPEDKEEKPIELPAENAVPKGDKTPVEPEAPKSEQTGEAPPAVETKPESGDKGEATANA